MHALIDWLSFTLHGLCFRLRDLRCAPADVLREACLQAGDHVLEYGCGPGSFTMLVAERVGPTGRVYAVDINPRAVQRVRQTADRRGLTNVELIETDQATGLAAQSVDAVLLYDTLHVLGAPGGVLAELHRVLKPGAHLSIMDHHMSEDALLAAVTGTGHFVLAARGKRTYSFCAQ